MVNTIFERKLSILLHPEKNPLRKKGKTKLFTLMSLDMFSVSNALPQPGWMTDACNIASKSTQIGSSRYLLVDPSRLVIDKLIITSRQK